MKISRYFVLCIFFFNSLYASSELIPRLTVKEVFISNSTALLDEEGWLTVISPGISYKKTLKRSEFNVDYAYNAELVNGLSREETENHNLAMSYSFTHIPEHWVTLLTGNIQQSTATADGTQASDLLTSSSNTSELRTYGINTAINNQIGRSINISSRLLADHADYENSGSTQSYGADLSVDNKISGNKLYWNASANTRISETESSDETIDSYQFGLNYRINPRYTTYVTANTSKTSNSEFDDTATRVGINWRPGKHSFIDVSTGVRGDNSSSSLNSRFTRRRVTLQLNYNEEVTSSRTEVLDGSSTDIDSLGTTYQSLQITPVFQKKADASITFNGKRTSVSLSFLSQVRSQASTTSEEEKTEAVSVALNRQLSSKSSVSMSYKQQNTETTQTNDLTSFQASFNKEVYKNVSLSTWFNTSEQTSDAIANEYKENSLGVAGTVRF